MNDVAAQYGHVTVAQSRGTRGLHAPVRVLGQAAPKDIVLATTIHADDRAMMMVVRQGPLPRAPDDVENYQVGCADQNVGEGTSLFTERRDDAARFGDRAANHLADRVAAAFSESGAAVGGETIDIEHCYTPDFRRWRPDRTTIYDGTRSRAARDAAVKRRM